MYNCTYNTFIGLKLRVYYVTTSLSLLPTYFVLSNNSLCFSKFLAFGKGAFTAISERYRRLKLSLIIDKCVKLPISKEKKNEIF